MSKESPWTVAHAKRVLTDPKNFDYLRDADGTRFGRTKYIMLSTKEAAAISRLLTRPTKRASK